MSPEQNFSVSLTLTSLPLGGNEHLRSLSSFFSAQAPEISSIFPDVVSFYGKNQVVLKGRNLGDVTGVRIQASVDCKPQE